MDDAIAARQFFERGWLRFGWNDQVAEWARHALPAARNAVADPANVSWLRCGGTWFVGVHALPNGPNGAVAAGPPLAGPVVDCLPVLAQPWRMGLDRAQISACYPGYPKPMPGESQEAFNYRLRRDAAHVDGIAAEGPQRRRHLREPHAFLLGLPLTNTTGQASPLVAWEGSHVLVRDAFHRIYEGLPPERWPDIDVTEPYQALRRKIFDRCKRVIVSVQPGEAYLLHRLTLHGVSPWAPDATASPDGRMIAYFRPAFANVGDWLTAG
jgi:hypothetical protein